MFRASVPALAMAALLGAGAGALAMMLARDATPPCPQDGASAAGAGDVPDRSGATATFASRGLSAPGPSAGRGSRNGLGAGDATQAVDTRPDADQLLKDLLTLPWSDRRSMRDRLVDFLAEHPGRDGVAVASRGVFDLAGNRELLPDAALAGLYLEPHDPAFRRVLAQVASMRGDNRLIELHVAEAGMGLHSALPEERQRALVELARTRHVAAADLAAPLLADRDTGVVLDALLALRASGNQRHLAGVQRLLEHPDEAVSWLARDVAADLRMLSDQARTRIADSELSAELPPLPPPPANCLASR